MNQPSPSPTLLEPARNVPNLATADVVSVCHVRRWVHVDSIHVQQIESPELSTRVIGTYERVLSKKNPGQNREFEDPVMTTKLALNGNNT